MNKKVFQLEYDEGTIVGEERLIVHITDNPDFWLSVTRAPYMRKKISNSKISQKILNFFGNQS
jgi:hypothetical protein